MSQNRRDMPPRRRLARRGVTLLELAIVLAIMSILAASAFSYYANTRDQARRSKALEDMNTLRNAVKAYRADPFNTGNLRPARAADLVTCTFSGTETKMVQTGGAVVEQEQPVTVKRHFIDRVPKSPWGLDYNIDLFNVVAWNTDRHVERRGTTWGERLAVPYTNVNTDEFDASPAPSAWTFAASGAGAWSWGSGAVLLTCGEASADGVHLCLAKEILVKGTRTEAAPAPDAETRLMDVDWGGVIDISFEFEQIRPLGADVSIDDGIAGGAALDRLEQTTAEHVVDFDPVVLEREMCGAIYLWPKSKSPAILGSPTDGDGTSVYGLRFSDRRWEILPDARVIVPNLPPEGSAGEWAPGRHDVRFVSKYDEVGGFYLLDVSIDGDYKYSIKFPPGGEDHFRLTISPDQFADPARTIAGQMTLHAVTVSGYDFSKHYPQTLWPEAKTFGR